MRRAAVTEVDSLLRHADATVSAFAAVLRTLDDAEPDSIAGVTLSAPEGARTINGLLRLEKSLEGERTALVRQRTMWTARAAAAEAGGHWALVTTAMATTHALSTDIAWYSVELGNVQVTFNRVRSDA